MLCYLHISFDIYRVWDSYSEKPYEPFSCFSLDFFLSTVCWCFCLCIAFILPSYHWIHILETFDFIASNTIKRYSLFFCVVPMVLLSHIFDPFFYTLNVNSIAWMCMEYTLDGGDDIQYTHMSGVFVRMASNHNVFSIFRTLKISHLLNATNAIAAHIQILRINPKKLVSFFISAFAVDFYSVLFSVFVEWISNWMLLINWPFLIAHQNETNGNDCGQKRFEQLLHFDISLSVWFSRELFLEGFDDIHLRWNVWKKKKLPSVTNEFI